MSFKRDSYEILKVYTKNSVKIIKTIRRIG